MTRSPLLLATCLLLAMWRALFVGGGACSPLPTAAAPAPRPPNDPTTDTPLALLRVLSMWRCVCLLSFVLRATAKYCQTPQETHKHAAVAKPAGWSAPWYIIMIYDAMGRRHGDTPGTRILSRRSGGSERTTAVCSFVALV